MKYRREIDGLRAVAVVPVILFHAGFPAFRGGFVGVDVFFVISGFLITIIIVDDVDLNRFSVVRFYERRARRILPALFVVMLACLPCAWQLLSPHDLVNFSQSLAAIALFASNVLFWGESGYFDTEAELKPLLHTWSLAVEEQFYLLYPLVLLVLLRCGRKVAWPVIAAAAIASLWISTAQVQSHPSSAFYLLPSRAWELLLGCLAAAAARRYGLPAADRAAGAWMQAASAIGLLVVVASVFLFDERTPFPGLNALVPTVATATILLTASQSTAAGRLLGSPLFVGVGLISYSVYLWHQPVFAFVRHACLGQPSAATMAAACALVPALAMLSWHFVEQPFRDRDRIDRRGVLAASLTGLLLFLAIGLYGYWQQDAVTQWRLRGVSAEARRKLRTRPALLADRDGVVIPLLQSADRPFSADSPKRKVLILGDSMSEDLYAAVSINADLFPGIEFRRCLLDDTCMQDFAAVLTAGESSPVYRTGNCRPNNVRLYQNELLRQADIVVLCAQWLPYMTVTTHEGPLTLAETLASQGRTVGVVGLLLMQEAASTEFLAVRNGWTTEQANRMAYATILHGKIDPPNAAARTLAARTTSVTYLDKYSIFCSDTDHTVRFYDRNDRMLFADGSHLTGAGLAFMGRRIAELGWFTGRATADLHEKPNAE